MSGRAVNEDASLMKVTPEMSATESLVAEHLDQLPPKISLFKELAHNLLKRESRFIVDVDIGGTFTDAIVFRKDHLELFKVETTPHDMSLCVRQVLEQALKAFGEPDLASLLRKTEAVRLSTSISTNTLLERKGQRCGVLLTAGWRNRYLSQPCFTSHPSSIVYSEDVLEIREREGLPAITRGDSDLEDEVALNVGTLLDQGVTFIVVSLFESEKYPDKEETVKKIIQKYYPRHFIRSAPVLKASQVSKSSDYILRTNTAVANAYCHRPLAFHYYRVEEFLRSQGFIHPILVVNVSGGTTRIAKTKAIQTINSGAAASICGVSLVAQQQRQDNVVSIDLGGTSTEIGLVYKGTIVGTHPSLLNNVSLDISFPVLATLAVGGGSIAMVNHENEILLGPQSAATFPGPACYDLGGAEPTLTDAFLVLGYIDENYYLGGSKRIKLQAAREVLMRMIGSKLGISCEEAALKIKDKALEVIGNGIRNAVGDRPLDLTKTPLFALGGAGGCLGVQLADSLGMPYVHVFRYGAMFGAFGSSKMNIMHVYETKTALELLPHKSGEDNVCRTINGAVADLQRIAYKDMRGEGFGAEEIRFELELEITDGAAHASCDIRLETPFLWPPRDLAYLIDTAQKSFKNKSDGLEGNEAWVSRIRVKAFGSIPHYEYVPYEGGDMHDLAPKGSRKIYSGNNRMVEAAVYEWDSIPVPSALEGPVILESPETTVCVPQRKRITFCEDRSGIVLSREM